METRSRLDKAALLTIAVRATEEYWAALRALEKTYLEDDDPDFDVKADAIRDTVSRMVNETHCKPCTASAVVVFEDILQRTVQEKTT